VSSWGTSELSVHCAPFSPVGSMPTRAAPSASLLRGGDTSAEPCSPSFVAIHRAYDWGVLMDGRFESAVFISQLIDGYGAGGWRRRRLVRSACWHMIDDNGALTRCGIAFSYTSPRRPWRAIADDQRCQSCLEQHERVTPETSQTNLGLRAG